jgi:hypothetical protein
LDNGSDYCDTCTSIGNGESTNSPQKQPIQKSTDDPDGVGWMLLSVFAYACVVILGTILLSALFTGNNMPLRDSGLIGCAIALVLISLQFLTDWLNRISHKNA